MDGLYLYRAGSDWWQARHVSLIPEAWDRLRQSPDESIRLGLLHNPFAPTSEINDLAWAELRRHGNVTTVLIEVACSRRVGADVLCEVATWVVWEVWAVLLHNPNCPDDVLQTIINYNPGDETLRREYAYLVARAKEIIKARAR